LDYIDHKYIGLVSGYLSHFKKKNGVYNFRCPFCGDSKKDKHKARGYILDHKGNAVFKCHNCGDSTSLAKLIKHVSPNISAEYSLEKFKESYIGQNQEVLANKQPDITSPAKPKFIRNSPLKNLQKISQLRPDHPAKKYVQERLIPPQFHFKLFYTPSFKKWVNSFIPDKFDLKQKDSGRIIIPLLDQYGNFIGVQGRSLSKKGQRYITIIADETKPKIYGLDHTNIAKYTYVFEGPFDSLFVPNSIAMCGADCISALNQLNVEKNNAVIIYDNEPRNEEMLKRTLTMIEKGYNVCVWPSKVKHKDVNQMVEAGISPKAIKEVIDQNTFRGMGALMAFNQWKKT